MRSTGRSRRRSRGEIASSLVRLLVAGAAVLLLPAIAGAVPGAWSVDAPKRAEMGQPARFSVVADGLTEPTVLLHYRGNGDSRYTTLSLRSEGGGRFSGEVPAEATRTTELRFYIEAHGQGGGPGYRLGSAEQPLSILVLKAAADDDLSRIGIEVGGAISAMLVVVLLAWRLDRRRRNVLVDQLFWARLLAPLSRLPRQSAIDQAARLAERTIDHPVRGRIQLSLDEILDRLREVRKLDLERLGEQGSRILGSEVEALRPPAAAVRDRRPDEKLSDLAGRVGGLCAISYLLARAREERGEGDSQSIEQMVQPLARVREEIRRTQALVKEGRSDEAGQLLTTVSEKVERIHKRVNALDQAQDVDEFVHTVERCAAITADLLCRLVEYRALHASRSTANRRKLLVVLRALAARDAIEDHSPDGVRLTLVRRRLLTSTRKENLPEDLVAQSTQLRATIEQARPARMAEIDRLHAQVEEWIDSLGKMLYTMDGLSHAVALQVTLQHKKVWLEGRELGSFDLVAAELEELVQMGDQTLEFVTDEGDDSVAVDHLDRVVAEMLDAVAANQCPQRGFHLEPVELAAACDDGAEPKWSYLVVRAAACRTAIDRLARQHAKARQPEGKEPPALPVSLALGLVRMANHIETDIREQDEADIILGRPDRTAETGRIINRLTRARLGLAVLGELPATGFGGAEPTSSSAPTAAARFSPAAEAQLAAVS